MVEGQFGTSYLIIPAGHYESLLDLPDNWWQDMKSLLGRVPGLAGDYNLSLNYGKNAGQSLKHLHFWVIPREDGKPSSGKGFARLIAEADDSQAQE
jgi:diadenosine tetraphosphate (Ap4A) HIT family hydrolase